MIVWPDGAVCMQGGQISTEYDYDDANPIILRGGELEGWGSIRAHIRKRGYIF